MLVNAANVSAMFGGFKVAFNSGFGGAQTVYTSVAMVVPSNSRSEDYGWVDMVPGMREWIGPRHVKNLSVQGYTIKNRDFEQTISVARNDVEDDKYGVLSPFLADMGRAAAEMPDKLVMDLLKAGFTTACADGQNFFDSDHPVGDGVEIPRVSVSNVQAGSGEGWYLLDTSRQVKPLVFQERRPLGALVSKDRPSDDNVFFQKEFIYGSDGRCNAGFGLWQLAFGSKADLTAANYKAARVAMQQYKSDGGRLLGIMPTTLVVGPANEEAALKLINSEYGSGGETNPWKGTAKLIVTPWVAA